MVSGSRIEYVPLLITFLSTHQSPKTVNKKASEFVIGTVSESSVAFPVSHVSFPDGFLLPATSAGGCPEILSSIYHSQSSLMLTAA